MCPNNWWTFHSINLYNTLVKSHNKTELITTNLCQDWVPLRCLQWLTGHRIRVTTSSMSCFIQNLYLDYGQMSSLLETKFLSISMNMIKLRMMQRCLFQSSIHLAREWKLQEQALLRVDWKEEPHHHQAEIMGQENPKWVLKRMLLRNHLKKKAQIKRVFKICIKCLRKKKKRCQNKLNQKYSSKNRLKSKSRLNHKYRLRLNKKKPKLEKSLL